MLLTYKTSTTQIPMTSTCIVNTKGRICDGNIVTVSSPIFPSINFSSGPLNVSETFQVPFFISNDNGYIDNPKGELHATLVCNDGDIFNMYVKENT